MRWNDFFGKGNDKQLQWSELSLPENKAGKALEPFISLVKNRAPVAALPRVSGDRVFWYIGWREARESRFARDLLRAFLGRTYAQLKDPPRALIPADDVDRAFSDEFGGNVFVVEVANKLREDARKRLLAMAKCLANQPHRQGQRLRSVGSIVRDVEFALQQGDDASAIASIEELRRGGHLTSTNLEFLTLRRLAVQGAWSSIVAYPGLTTLLEIGPPRRVCESVIQALYHCILCPGGVVPSPQEWLRRLKEEILPAYEPAFRSSIGLVALEAQACFAVLPILRSQPRSEYVDQALIHLSNAGWSDIATVIHSVWDSLTPETTQPSITEDVGPTLLVRDWLNEARQAFDDDDTDQAYQLALQAEPSRAQATMLVRCSLIIGDTDSAIHALAAWDRLPPDEQALASSRGRTADSVARLRGRVGQPEEPNILTTTTPIDGWVAWFSRLRIEVPWPGAIAAADIGQRTWSVAEVLSEPEAIASVVGIIESTLPRWAADALRHSLPFLLEAFASNKLDSRAAPVIDSLFEVLATDESHSVPTCEALIRIAQFRLGLSLDATKYQQMLEAISNAIESVASPVIIPTSIGALEMLIETQSPTTAVRQNTAIRVLQYASRWWKRISVENRSLLRSLAEEFKVAEVLTQVEESSIEPSDKNPWDVLQGKYVALYSLDEGALARTEKALKGICPSVRVSTFAEQVATGPLEEAAKRADLFVIATKVATHAATTFIEKFVESSRVAYASGKGSTSLLQAVRAWASR